MKLSAEASAAGPDFRLITAIRQGHLALPEDLGLLHGYLRLIDSLLAEKAGELETSWSHCDAASAEIETLQSLEAAVAERAIGVRADGLSDVQVKLEIWRALAENDAAYDAASPSHRMILSIVADLQRYDNP